MVEQKGKTISLIYKYFESEKETDLYISNELYGIQYSFQKEFFFMVKHS